MFHQDASRRSTAVLVALWAAQLCCAKREAAVDAPRPPDGAVATSSDGPGDASATPTPDTVVLDVPPEPSGDLRSGVGAAPPAAAEPRLADDRFAVLASGPEAAFGSGCSHCTPDGEAARHTPPQVAETSPPDGVRSVPPDVGEEARADLQARFGCDLVRQLQWPASWLSPTGVVVRCCRIYNHVRGLPQEAFRIGCLALIGCSLLIEEQDGTIVQVKSEAALRRRVLPFRGPRDVLAFLDAVERDVVPFFGDVAAERDFVGTGRWLSAADTIRGTRVVPAAETDDAGSGWEVTTFIRRGCGCRHDLEEVTFVVTETGDRSERGRRTVLQDPQMLCAD